MGRYKFLISCNLPWPAPHPTAATKNVQLISNKNFISSTNKMQQTHRGERNNWGGEQGQRGQDVEWAGHRKKSLDHQVSLFHYFVQYQPHFIWLCTKKKKLWKSIETLMGHMHMHFFRVHRSSSLWPLAVAASGISLPAYSLEWSKLGLTRCSQAKCVWRVPITLSPIWKFRTNCKTDQKILFCIKALSTTQMKWLILIIHYIKQISIHKNVYTVWF